MTSYRFIVYLLVFGLLLSSCYEEPEYPLEPKLVGFDGITFIENETGVDTLKIRVTFEDGDGDLGLSGSGADTESPYNEINLLTDQQGNLIEFNSNNPDPPFNCEDYYVVQDSFQFYNGIPLDRGDTLRAEYNRFGRNLEIRLFQKQASGEFQEYDFQARCLPALGGRFPRLKESFENTKPLKGVIQYDAISATLLPLFRNDTLQIRVQIRDRALNESNIIISEPFTLRGVEAN